MAIKIKTIFSILILSNFFFSCIKKEASFSIISFNSIANPEFKTNDSVVNINADLSDAAIYGINIPSANQCASGAFVFNFEIKQNKKERLFYKIYYQNETYKFGDQHPLSGENFYGSWEDVSIGFKPIAAFDGTIKITDSFRIVGNPRNEYVFYGSNPEFYEVTDTMIALKKAAIKANEGWYNEIVKKAEKQKIKPEEQLHLDALWALDFDKNADKSFNNRWRRNPRMGEYKIMLVVVNEEELKKTPRETKALNTYNQQQQFVNPFSYFNPQKNNAGMIVTLGDKKIKVTAKMDLGSGIYIGKTGVNKSNYSTAFYNSACGSHDKLYRKAHFQQYFHYINRDFPLKNIPEIIDVMEPSFTREKYEELKKQYEASNKFIDTYVNSSDCPCKTVISDSINKTITLINPGNKEGQFKKEHVGIQGRIGFTYGKWRAKIKFPELINGSNVWNGITNAFWLLSQEGDADWNMRRPCNAEIAYIPKSEGDNEAALWKSRKQLAYSEIDFEILKESQYWPQTSYKNKKNFPKEDAAKLDDITVTCTNWDMACHEPKKFDIGAKTNIIDEMEFVHHRWNPWYKALTTKVPAKNKEVFGGEYYYFEIEWTPEKIIWRIGPQKNQMKIIAIMNSEISAIPNNQMSALITQEWHNQEWWPTAPFKQNFVPFPKKDIIGKVLEIEVE